jgi:hypothetical protein
MDSLHFGWFLLVDVILWACKCERKWTWMNLFWNTLLTSIRYLENIIWHMGQNIWWCGRIFYRVFMDERYWRMINWMINENGWTFSSMFEFFFGQKIEQNKQDGKNYIGLLWKNQHMKCSSRTLYLFNMKFIKFCNI